MKTLQQALAEVFNKYGMDNTMNMPDYVLADLTVAHLHAVAQATAATAKHSSPPQLETTKDVQTSPCPW